MILGNSLLSNDKVIDQLIQDLNKKLDLTTISDQELKSSLVLPYSLQLKGKGVSNSLSNLITLGEDSKIKVGDISNNLLLSSTSIPSISYIKDGNQITAEIATADNVLPLTAGYDNPLTGDLVITTDVLRGIYFKNSTGSGNCGIEGYANNVINITATEEISFRNDYTGSYVSIKNNTLYQNGKEVAIKEDVPTSVDGLTGGTISSTTTIQGDLITQYLKVANAVHETSTYGKIPILSDNMYLRYRTTDEFKADLGVPSIIQNGELVKTLDVDQLANMESLADTYATKVEVAAIQVPIYWDITEEEA